MSDDAMRAKLGEHLRRLRKQRGLSLLEVQAASNGEVKASVLGAYERGERAISAPRLARLAGLYGLPLQAMVPPDATQSDRPSAVTIDVTNLDAATGDGAVVARFVRRLQAQRRDWTGGAFTIRAEDVTALAAAVDKSPAELIAMLDETGLRAHG